MFKGKGVISYSFMKIALFVIGFIEYINYSKPDNKKKLIILISIFIINSLLRQICLYRKDSLFGYGRISIILEFLLGVFIAWQRPIGAVILLLTPTIVESVVAYSPLFGGCTSAATLITLIIIDTTDYAQIFDYGIFFRRVLVTYGIGFILVYVTSYMAGLQFQERKRIARINEELERAYKQLMDNAANLQELSIEKERNRMAREIHDTLAHTLTAVVVQLEACKKLIDVDTEKAREELAKAQESTRAGLSDVKRTIKALRPQMLENSSLTGALNNLVTDIEESTSVKVELHQNLQQELKLSSSVEVSLFRVIQESITNAIRHGAAEQIDISMTEKDSMLNIEISDNGRGCSHIKEGYGLKGIIERIKALSGTVQFSSTVGKGFCTQIAIPYKGGINSND